MKTTSSLLFCLALLFCVGLLHASTPQGADEYLVAPWDYEGQTISLNVMFVRPARFQSPLADVIFYHAATITADRKLGGEILIAVPKTESEHFARFYGMNHHGRSSRILSGTLLLRRGPHFFWHKIRNHNSTLSTGGTTQVTGTTSNESTPDKRFDRSGEWFVDYKGLSSDIFDKTQNPALSGSSNQTQPSGTSSDPVSQ